VTAIPAAAWTALACSQCGGRLSSSASSLECPSCGTCFPIEQNGSIDLRLKKPKTFEVEFRLGTALAPPDFSFAPLKENPAREVDFTGKNIPWHLSAALLSYFPRARTTESLALDLGCGTGLHRDVCEAAGFQWVGLDYTDPTAPVLGDGHALPFTSESFDFSFHGCPGTHSLPVRRSARGHAGSETGRCFHRVRGVSRAVPWRQLLSPHHFGTYNTLQSAGFVIERVAPNAAWSSLQAQATMGGLFPRMPEKLGRAFVWPLGLLHKAWWRAGRLVSPKANETLRLLTNTGSFEFVARKP